jgi:hypothetical protein
MREKLIIMTVSLMVSFLAGLLFSAKVNVTEANPPQDAWARPPQDGWEPLPAIPPGNSQERIEIHPYPGVTVIYNPTDEDLDLPEEIRRLPLCPEVNDSPQPTPTVSAEQLSEPARCRARIGGIAKFDSNFIPPPGFLPSRPSGLGLMGNSQNTARSETSSTQ